MSKFPSDQSLLLYSNHPNLNTVVAGVEPWDGVLRPFRTLSIAGTSIRTIQNTTFLSCKVDVLAVA